MNTPKPELPDVEGIRRLAEVSLPEGFVLRDVRRAFGSEFPLVIPEDYDLTNEYEDTRSERIGGPDEAIRVFREWAHPLIQDIRSDWPAETLRVSFASREPPTSTSSA